MRYDIEPLKFDQGNRVQFINAQGWEANANGNASANFKFLFVNAYVCIWICVRVSHSCVSLHLYLRSVFASDV